MDCKVEVSGTECTGGFAYNYCLGLGRIDGKVPLVTPGEEVVKMELEGYLGGT